jgi:DNA recombination protein RmuC
LIALLKAVAFGWRQERLTQNAQQVSNLGKELYERLITLMGHFGELKKRIDGSVKAFDSTVGSLNHVLVPARKFHELGAAGGDQIVALEAIEKTTRDLPQRKESTATTEIRVKRIAAAAGDDGDPE